MSLYRKQTGNIMLTVWPGVPDVDVRVHWAGDQKLGFEPGPVQITEDMNTSQSVQTDCNLQTGAFDFTLLLPDDPGVSLQGGVSVSTAVPPRVQIHTLVTLETTHTSVLLRVTLRQTDRTKTSSSSSLAAGIIYYNDNKIMRWWAIITIKMYCLFHFCFIPLTFLHTFFFMGACLYIECF